MKEWLRERVARLLYLLGFKPCATTSIAGSIEYGYGRLDGNGWWQFTLWSVPSALADAIEATDDATATE